MPLEVDSYLKVQRLQEWFEENKFKINTSKTIYIEFTHPRRRNNKI